MTLNTSLRLLAPLPDIDFVRNLHRKANEVMGVDYTTVRFKEEDAHMDKWGSHRDASIDNEPGQGFPAWLMLKFKLGASPLWRFDPTATYEDEEDREWEERQPGPYWAELSYDTAYGYQDEYGGCGNLHARLLAEVGAWLDEHAMPWAVQNEFTGAWYQDEERYLGLMSLLKRGEEARNWFANTVQPALIVDAVAKGQHIEFN